MEFEAFSKIIQGIAVFIICGIIMNTNLSAGFIAGGYVIASLFGILTSLPLITFRLI